VARGEKGGEGEMSEKRQGKGLKKFERASTFSLSLNFWKSGGELIERKEIRKAGGNENSIKGA